MRWIKENIVVVENNDIVPAIIDLDKVLVITEVKRGNHYERGTLLHLEGEEIIRLTIDFSDFIKKYIN